MKPWSVVIFIGVVAWSLAGSTQVRAKCTPDKPCLKEKRFSSMGTNLPPFHMSYPLKKGMPSSITVSAVKKGLEAYCRQYNQVDPKELEVSNDKVKVYYRFAMAYISVSDDPESILQGIFNVEYDWKPFNYTLDAAVNNTFLLETKVVKNKNGFDVEIKYPDIYSRTDYGEGKADPNIDPFERLKLIFDSQKISEYFDKNLGRN